MVKRSTSAGLDCLIVIVIGVLLLAPVSSAIPASGLAAQEADMTATPPAVAADETAQPVETSQPQGVPPAAQGSDHSPVMFVENAGQWDDGARFQVWGGPAGTVWLAEDAIWITVLERAETSTLSTIPEGQVDKAADPGLLLSPDDRVSPSPSRGVNIKLSFVGANPQPRIETFERVETVVSYFLGNDPAQWRPEVPVWGGVRYVELYSGIDLELSGEHGQMVLRLATRTGADQGAVRLRVEGADTVAVNDDVLRLGTAAGEVAWPLLSTRGMEAGGAQAEPNGVNQFEVAVPVFSEDFRQPVYEENRHSPANNPADLLFGTYLGGGNNDFGEAITVDETGSTYVTGYTNSNGFPTTPGTFDPTYNGNYDIFLAKLNTVGNALVYATFLGGSGEDRGYAIATDESGSAYVAGGTGSNDFPTTQNAFDPSYNGGLTDASVIKLNRAGNELTYATFLGGSSDEDGRGIDLDEVGNAYVTGSTSSANFPTTPGAFDTSHNGSNDAFVAKLNPTGAQLAYGSFLGGAGPDFGRSVAADETGSAWMAGETFSSDFPATPSAFDPSYNGEADAFVVRLNATGTGLAYSTLLGGRSYDRGRAIALDALGNAYVVGVTESSDFPTTPNSFDPSYNGTSYGPKDTFVAKLNLLGGGLAYATFLGGSWNEYGRAAAVDGMGGVYVTGDTYSTDFPVTVNAFDLSYGGGFSTTGGDAFVAKLNPAGSALTYATFLGCINNDYGYSIAVDWWSSAYITGRTYTSCFPTTPGAYDPGPNGVYDAFVVKLAMGNVVPTATPTPTLTHTPTYTASPTPTRTLTNTPTPTSVPRYLPLVLHRFPAIPDAPVLNAISAPGTNSSYIVRWTASQSATSYLVQRATSASLADAVQIYAGAATTYNAPSQGIARYYYRVKARNQWGDSPWSNVQSVEVRWEQEPNYPLGQANGPLISGLNYYGYPNDSNDYFFFQVASRGQVTIDLTNHHGQGLQLLLRTPTGDLVTQVNTPPYHLVHTVDAGRYYIQIFSTGGFNTTTPYTLRGVFP